MNINIRAKSPVADYFGKPSRRLFLGVTALSAAGF